MSSDDGKREQALGESPEANDPEVIRLQQGIEQTRADMSATIQALETRLSPAEVRDKVGAELKQVEERVRVVIHEQLTEAKTLVQAELVEAKEILRGEMNEAEEKVRRGLSEARDTIKQDAREAFDGAKQAVRAATLGKVENLATKLGDKMNDTRDTLVDTVRNNPIPATLMGVGLVWLLMNRSKSASSRASGSNANRGITRGLGDAVDSAGSAVSNATHRASDAASKGLQQATDFAGNAAHSASEATMALAHRAGDAATHLAGQAGDVATSVAEGARKGVQRVEQGFETTLHEKPMVIGAAALALGAVVGFSLPRTSGEDSLMGQTRDRLLDRAGDAVHDAASSVTQLAEQTVEGAKQSLQEANAE